MLGPFATASRRTPMSTTTTTTTTRDRGDRYDPIEWAQKYKQEKMYKKQSKQLTRETNTQKSKIYNVSMAHLAPSPAQVRKKVEGQQQ